MKHLHLGIQDLLLKVDFHNTELMSRLKTTLDDIKKDATLADVTVGGGKNSRLALGRRINAVKDRLVSFA